MPDPYYGGKSAFDGKQFPLEAITFKECLERYINVPVVLRVTRAEYRKLDKAAKAQFKDGPFLTACTFDPDSPERNDENAREIRLAFLDFDAPSEAELKKGFVDYASDFAENFDALHEALHPFNYVAYYTTSSTKESPRFRVMVEVDNLPKHLYRQVIKALARKLGVLVDKWAGYKESKVLSQPMYRPGQFQGEEFTSVISSRTTGVAFDEFDIPDDIDDDLAAVTDLGFEGSDFTASSLAHLPVAGLTLEEVWEPLQKIDPDETYMTWFKVLTALKHQFRGEEADAAYEMFDQWSSEGAKYKGSDETAAKWKSATPEVKGRAPVTIRSLFKIAIDAGWDSAKLCSKFQEDLEAWMVGAETSALMNEGPERIAALPFANGIVEESLALRLKEAIKASGGGALDKRTILKSVRSERRKSLAETPEDKLPEWLRPWVFVSPENSFRHTEHGLQLSVQGFNNTYAIKLLKDDDEGVGKPSMMPSDFALNVLDLTRVEGVIYDPRIKETGEVEKYFKFQGRKVFNEFLPKSVPTPVPHGARKAMKLFRKLLHIITGNWDLVNLIIDYYAFWVQNPGIKIRWAFVFQSAQGGGKSMLGDITQALFGFQNTKIVEPGSITSDFNDWAVGCIALIVEEMFVPGRDRFRALNSMKTLITNDTISARIKNESMRVMLNTANAIFFTNFHSALFMEESDRRYCVVESPLQTKEDVEEVNKTGIWPKLAKLKKELAPALRYALLEHEVSAGFPVNGPAPMTEFREDNIHASKPEALVAIEDALEDEDVLTVGEDLVMMHRLMQVLGPGHSGKSIAIHLKSLNYRVHDGGKRFSFGQKERTTLWVHRSHFDDDLEDPVEVIAQRLKEETGQSSLD